MSDALETTGPTDVPVRSTMGVLAVLGGLLLLPIIALVIIFSLRSAGSAGSDAVVDHVDSARFQAVYLVNDEVFFGRVREADGDFIRLEDAFFLRRVQAAADAADDKPEASLDLVPVSQDVGGSGDLLVNTREVVRVQDLTKDSEIASSIEQALE